MGKYLLITALTSITTGVLGFYLDSDVGTTLQAMFYVSLDILAILVLAKFVFTSEVEAEVVDEVEDIQPVKSKPAPVVHKSIRRERKYPKTEHRIPATMETTI